ncbi:MAG: DUF72 domain-containing protein [bacterium]|nr:DUF72 domain-containing protein [bacterium]
MQKKKIRIGTSGFSFSDWKGIVYPEKISQDRMLEFYAKNLGFNAVEINSTYYRIPSSKIFELMSRKTPSNFLFSIKAFRGITHDPFDHRLEEKPDMNQIKGYLTQLRQAIKPLQDSEKLGALLFQFPLFFYPSTGSLDYILKIREFFLEIPVVMEFRNIAWAKEENYEFLTKNNLAFCAVDEPGLPRLMPLADVVTSNVAYLRCHGRNTNWFNTSISERYNYYYTDEELREIKDIAHSMIQKAEISFIFFNNCHAGHAAKNAMRFAQMLGIKLETEKDLF